MSQTMTTSVPSIASTLKSGSTGTLRISSFQTLPGSSGSLRKSPSSTRLDQPTDLKLITTVQVSFSSHGVPIASQGFVPLAVPGLGDRDRHRGPIVLMPVGTDFEPERPRVFGGLLPDDCREELPRGVRAAQVLQFRHVLHDAIEIAVLHPGVEETYLAEHPVPGGVEPFQERTGLLDQTVFGEPLRRGLERIDARIFLERFTI